VHASPVDLGASELLLLKKAVVVLGLLSGIVVSVRPRNVKVTAPVAGAVWGAGFGWLIVDTMA
jgi:hypothetical protein